MKRDRKYNKNLVQENLMNGLRHIVLFITGALLFASPLDGQVTLSFSNATSSSVDINYSSNTAIAGFQFVVEGVTLIDATSAFEPTDFGNNTVIAFNLDGGTLPAGFGTLLSLTFEESGEDQTLEVTNVVITDSDGIPIESSGPGNVDIPCNNADCAEECGGNAALDDCGVCEGDGAEEGFNCDGIPLEFVYNQSTSQAFYVIHSVLINEIEVDSNDWVGAFNGEICVGSRQWDTALCLGGVCDLPAMGDVGSELTAGYMQTGDIPTFKIYDTSENAYYDADASEDFPWVHNGVYIVENLQNIIEGCMGNSACNYNADATEDDGSCEYPIDYHDCDGNTIVDWEACVEDCDDFHNGNWFDSWSIDQTCDSVLVEYESGCIAGCSDEQMGASGLDGFITMCEDCLNNDNYTCDEAWEDIGGDGDCFCDDGVGGSIDSAEDEGDCLDAGGSWECNDGGDDGGGELDCMVACGVNEQDLIDAQDVYEICAIWAAVLNDDCLANCSEDAAASINENASMCTDCISDGNCEEMMEDDDGDNSDDETCNDESACNYLENDSNCYYYEDCAGECGGSNWDCPQWELDGALVGSWNAESNIYYDNSNCEGVGESGEGEGTPNAVILNENGTGAYSVQFENENDGGACQSDNECSNPFEGYFCEGDIGGHEPYETLVECEQDECGVGGCVFANPLGEDSESVCNENICELTVPITWASNSENSIVCYNNILFGSFCSEYSFDDNMLVTTELSYSSCYINTWSPAGGDNDCDEGYDACGVCDGDSTSCDEGCGPNLPGPSGCDNACGSDLADDECGVCGGDDSICLDACGVPNGDNSSCADCAGAPNGDAVVDNCGVCNGDDSQCWYIDINAKILSVGEGSDFSTDLGWDNLSRLGMHIAADDGYNEYDVPGFDCDDCYQDYLDSPVSFPDGNFDFHFPHPEWVDDIDPIFGTTDIRKDIRSLEKFDLIDCNDSTAFLVNGLLYFKHQVWDVNIKSDIDIPYSQENVELEFNFTNEFLNPGFTKAFLLMEIASGDTIVEIINGDIFSIEDYGSPTGLKIIIGTDDVLPSVEFISPLPYQIFNINNDLAIQLEFENQEYIDTLEVYFEVNGFFSNTIIIPKQEYYYIPSSEFETFFDTTIVSDFSENVSVHIEIIDIATGGVSSHPNGEYSDVVEPLTFSRNTSTTELESGWHLLSPPLGGDHALENLFHNPAYGCSDGCEVITETVNSGTGFYVESNGEIGSFNGEVLSKSSLFIEQGWNLIGNPLVTPIDINSVIINYNGNVHNWLDAAELGIISPTPIIYDNNIASHVGTSLIPTAAGFWVHSFEDNVEISFIPSNQSPGEVSTLYWDLSLFAKENTDNDGAEYNASIGSEIVIGIHEEANDGFIAGEDQEAFPLDPLGLFNNQMIEHYTKISITNGDQSLISRDIRSYHDTLIVWDISVESIDPISSSSGIKLKWDSPEQDDPYDYYLDKHVFDTNNCESIDDIDENCIDMKVNDNIIVDAVSSVKITAVLKTVYIGCTHPLAYNYNEKPNGEDCEEGFCLGGDQTEFCEILSLFVQENYSIDPNDDDQALELPISLTNSQGLEIEGLQFVLKYDANFIQLNGVNLSDTLNNYEIIQQNNTTSIPAELSELSVTVYYVGGGELFSGEGEILSLSGNGLNTGETTISFTSVLINENANSFGNECNVTMGTASYNIPGELIYYYNGAGVFESSIDIVETGNSNNSYSTTTNNEGNFVESVIGNLFYEITLSKDEYDDDGDLDNYFDGLSAVDASRIARHSVGLYNNFTKEQKRAANVNFDYRCEDENENPTGENESDCQSSQNIWAPNIEAGDASKVARYAAGIIEDLDDQCDPHWIFIDPDGNLMLDEESCDIIPFALDSLTSNINDLVFEGIRLGDVTGNWSAPLGRQNEDYFMDNPMVEVELDEIIKLPIYLPNNVEIEGIDLTIQYDPEVFSLIGYSNRNSILKESTYPTIINEETSGLFKLVSYANSTPIYDNGLLGYIKFKVVSQTTAHSTISMVEMEVNEIPEGGFLIVDGIDSGNISRGFDFHISAVPEVFALNKNYPNPFNPSTNIQFDLPNDGDVKIFIYDIKGAHIDELVNGHMEAGYHQIKWDGSRQASGMYFIQMIADNGNYIKMSKMMLVK